MKLLTLIIGVVVLPCISAVRMSIDTFDIGHSHEQALPATPANTNTNGNNQNNGNTDHIDNNDQDDDDDDNDD